MRVSCLSELPGASPDMTPSALMALRERVATWPLPSIPDSTQSIPRQRGQTSHKRKRTEEAPEDGISPLKIAATSSLKKHHAAINSQQPGQAAPPYSSTPQKTDQKTEETAALMGRIKELESSVVSEEKKPVKADQRATMAEQKTMEAEQKVTVANKTAANAEKKIADAENALQVLNKTNAELSKLVAETKKAKDDEISKREALQNDLSSLQSRVVSPINLQCPFYANAFQNDLQRINDDQTKSLVNGNKTAQQLSQKLETFSEESKAGEESVNALKEQIRWMQSKTQQQENELQRSRTLLQSFGAQLAQRDVESLTMVQIIAQRSYQVRLRTSSIRRHRCDRGYDKSCSNAESTIDELNEDMSIDDEPSYDESLAEQDLQSSPVDDMKGVESALWPRLTLAELEEGLDGILGKGYGPLAPFPSASKFIDDEPMADEPDPGIDSANTPFKPERFRSDSGQRHNPESPSKPFSRGGGYHPRRRVDSGVDSANTSFQAGRFRSDSGQRHNLESASTLFSRGGGYHPRRRDRRQSNLPGGSKGWANSNGQKDQRSVGGGHSSEYDEARAIEAQKRAQRNNLAQRQQRANR